MDKVRLGMVAAGVAAMRFVRAAVTSSRNGAAWTSLATM